MKQKPTCPSSDKPECNMVSFTSAGTAFSVKLKILHHPCTSNSALSVNRSSPLKIILETSTRHNQILAAATIRSHDEGCLLSHFSFNGCKAGIAKSKAVDRSLGSTILLMVFTSQQDPMGCTRLHHSHPKPQRIQIARTTKIISNASCLRKLKFSLQSTC